MWPRPLGSPQQGYEEAKQDIRIHSLERTLPCWAAESLGRCVRAAVGFQREGPPQLTAPCFLSGALRWRPQVGFGGALGGPPQPWAPAGCPPVTLFERIRSWLFQRRPQQCGGKSCTLTPAHAFLLSAVFTLRYSWGALILQS